MNMEMALPLIQKPSPDEERQVMRGRSHSQLSVLYFQVLPACPVPPSCKEHQLGMNTELTKENLGGNKESLCCLLIDS